jgi:threonine/homoserine/homoserine lactone efflux protein
LWLAWKVGTKSALFVRGLISNLLNPKAGIFYVAILRAFMNEGAPATRFTAS